MAAGEQKMQAMPMPIMMIQPNAQPVFRYEPLVVVAGQQDFSQEEQLTYLVKGRPAFAFVDIYLKQNQKVLANAGAMLWMDGGQVALETACHGGCWASCCRTCSGESCCQNTFLNVAAGVLSKVTFGFHAPGDMLPFAVTPGNGWILTRKAFVVGSDNIVVDSRFAGCAACYCSGEGAFLTKVSVQPEALLKKGMFFAGSYGSLERHEVPAGKSFFLETGLFFAAHESTPINIGLAGGLITCCYGQQGFVMQFYGPCVIYTKSRNPKVWEQFRWHHAARFAAKHAKTVIKIAARAH